MTSHPPAVPRIDVATGEGPAQVRAHVPDPTVGRSGTLLLGHGAGGQRDAADVLALTDVGDLGWTVVLVDQPWRVAGRNVATRPASLDRAWTDVLTTLASPDWQDAHGLPLPGPWVVGGRSAGARVACRTSVVDGHPRSGVGGVLCLAFPLHPPGRPDRSRADELALPVGAGLPTLVVQGSTDPFGSPDEVSAAVRGDLLTLCAVPAAHSPSRDLRAVRAHVTEFLATLAPAVREDHP
ncbi:MULTISPECIES: alpha/beta family hydrolase [unclassified Ornithinimicrobium]|uniref:alpha/beta hydrolase family protein n=1 Tax=unclassified Ornithinimicrobium TaxID=2615080 RepID=UPI003851B0CD